MATLNQLDTTGKALNKGEACENLFRSLAEKNGFTVQEASERQDRIYHFDFILSSAFAEPFKVEVKSKKDFSILSLDNTRTNEFLLIEWVGVTGREGWIFGLADWIAFEQEDGFYLTPRMLLRELAQKLCSDQLVDCREKMLYKTYGRKGRKDAVSAILLSDIVLSGNYHFWKK